MQKQRIENASPIDAIVAVSKRLSIYEASHGKPTEEFFDNFAKGQYGDDIDFVEWANDYGDFLALKFELEKSLRHVA